MLTLLQRLLLMSTPAQDTQTAGGKPPGPIDKDSERVEIMNMWTSTNLQCRTNIWLSVQRSKTLGHILEVLKGSTIAEVGSGDVQSKFWATYKKVSKGYDDDFLDRATDDMSIILTFVCLLRRLLVQF